MSVSLFWCLSAHLFFSHLRSQARPRSRSLTTIRFIVHKFDKLYFIFILIALLFCVSVVSSIRIYRMDKTNSASVIWKIDNFKDSTAYQNSCSTFKIFCKNNEYFLGFEPQDKTVYLHNQFGIYLFRAKPRTSDVSVLWKVALISEDGHEILSNDIETGFTVKNMAIPIYGGLYHIDRGFILDPSNRLLPDGKLVIKCQVIDLEISKSSIADPKFALANLKALEDYQSLLENSKHSDVVFVVGRKKFKLHKAILSARSPVFGAMFDSVLEESKKNRVEITDVEVEVFEEMLRFIYGGKVEAMEQYAEDLLVVSDKYQLESLKSICEQSLSNNLTVETVTQVFTLADMHHAPELKSNCIQFITSNASKVTPTEGWKQMAKQRADLLAELYEDIMVKFEKK